LFRNSCQKRFVANAAFIARYGVGLALLTKLKSCLGLPPGCVILSAHQDNHRAELLPPAWLAISRKAIAFARTLSPTSIPLRGQDVTD
jgi:hypothetical protein